MTVGERIRLLRKEKGLTQEELSFDIGISRQTILKWEKNIVLPDLENSRILCNYFNITLDYLLKGENYKESEEKNNHFKTPLILVIIILFGIILMVVSFIFLIINNRDINVESGSSKLNFPVEIVLIIVSFVLIIVPAIILLRVNRKNVNK